MQKHDVSDETNKNTHIGPSHIKAMHGTLTSATNCQPKHTQSANDGSEMTRTAGWRASEPTIIHQQGSSSNRTRY